ncbi:putative fructokinase-3, partial [Ananas comosus]
GRSGGEHGGGDSGHGGDGGGGDAGGGGGVRGEARRSSGERGGGGGPARRGRGGAAAFVGKVGDDAFGRMVAGALRRCGVDSRGVATDSAARTGLAFVSRLPDGERDFLFYRHPSADMLLTPAELPLPLISTAAIFHFGSISLIAEPCRSAQLRAMAVAAEGGALLSYDPNLRLQLWASPEEARRTIMSVWGLAHIAKVSKSELEFLTERRDGLSADGDFDAAAMELWSSNLKLLIVTLGLKGCRYYAKDFRGKVESFEVKQVDSTGAGDAFVGAVLRKIADDPSILHDEKKLREVLRFANACGAITTTKEGGILSIPDEEEVMLFLENAK